MVGSESVRGVCGLQVPSPVSRYSVQGQEDIKFTISIPLTVKLYDVLFVILLSMSELFMLYHYQTAEPSGTHVQTLILTGN